METYSFGEWLKERRSQFRLTQREVAAAAHCSPAMIRKIEADERQPSPELAYLLADVLQIAPEQREVFVEVARGQRPLDALSKVEGGTKGITTAAPVPVSSHNLPSQATPLPERALPFGIITFLFTDIQGSTPLWEQDPGGMRASLQQHNAILHKAITANGGQVFKTVGDAFQAAFVAPAAALAAALAGQRGLAAATWGSTGPLLVRMGLHLGHVKVEGDDYVTAHTLNRVARIMSAGHGGQILLSSEVAAMVRHGLPQQVTLLDLGQHRLKGMREPEHIYQLVAPDLPGDFPPLQSLPVFPSNLPAQATPFIGRAQELAELSALMSQDNARLITIVGPGGMGKTRLSLAFAEQFVGSQSSESSPFPNGTYFVNLAPLSEVEHIIPTLAEGLHFPLQGNERDKRSPRQQILDYLHEKQMLIIMDNFEHLLTGADLVTGILQTAPGVQIVVTSRERLHLQQEQVYPIQGLEFPDWETPEDAAQYSAVQLFRQSARRNQPDFQLTGSDDLTYLARICRLVAGMPLAIELAAAWVDTLSLAEIAGEIQANLDFLETEMRDVPERHRSIRAAIDISWQKLTADEQTLFAQLSVFRGGFTRRAGQTITTASLRLLSRLVAKSFLQYNQERDRYQIHELMRQFGAEKLAVNGELETAVRRQHSAYYCQALAERTTTLKGQQQKVAIAEIEADIENSRAAWNWAVRHQDAALLNQAMFSLFRFYEWNGRYQDYQEAVAAAIAMLNRSQAIPAQQAVLIKLLYLKFDQTTSKVETKAILEQSRALLARLAQAEVEVTALQAEDEFYQGQYHAAVGDYPRAERALHNSLAYFQQSGEQWKEIAVWQALSSCAAKQGQFTQAEEFAQQALILARAVGDRWHMVMALHDLGFIFNNQGQYAAYRRFIEEGLEIAQELGLLPMQGIMQMEIGTSYLVEVRPSEAILYHQESLTIFRQTGQRQMVAWTMIMLAWDNIALEDTKAAEQWLQEGNELVRNTQNLRTLAYYLITRCILALIMGRYDEALIHAQEAAAVVKETDPGVDMLAFVFVALGWAQLVHEQSLQAEKSFYEALMTKNVFTRDVLLPIAYLLVRRQRTSESVKQAWQLIGLWEQSSVYVGFRLFTVFAERFQPPELLELPAEDIEAAKEYGRSHNPDTVIAELVEELPKLGWGL